MASTELATGVAGMRPVAAVEGTRRALGPGAAGSERGTGEVAAPGAAPAGGETRVAPLDVKDTVGRLNDMIQDLRRELRFSVDESSGRTVITVLDADTREVVRQIPPEQVLTLFERMEGARGGAIMDVEV